MSTPTSAITRLLTSMERWNASDVFVREGSAPAARVNGAIQAIDMAATTADEMDAFVAAVMLPHQRAVFDATGDADVGYSLADGRRFRFNFARSQGQRSFVARALPTGALDLVELGHDPEIAELAALSRGLVLVTGATGSGKSTTLAALVHEINRTRAVHVVTIEDPIEFVHADKKARVTQREVGGDTTGFAEALRGVVRQSPDVILIGEMRDVETMQVAVSAALTGHLVFATLHTINATQTLQRILSYYPEHLREQGALDISLALEAVVSQRLVPRSDGSGRALAVETLRASPGVRRLIRERRVVDLEDMMRAGTGPEMRTFNESLLRLYVDGAITLETGRAYASNADEFALATQGMATGQGTFRTDSPGAASGLDMKALLGLAMEKGASDLHLTVGRPPIFRISGTLYPLQVRPLSEADLRILLYSILTSGQRSTYEIEREIDFALSIDKSHRFRVNAYFQKGKMACALRAIPSLIPDATTLGIPSQVMQLGTRPHGLLLVVGPTGSGKSTTLACLVDAINLSRACRIITVEDPIEYTHESKMATVDQREVHADTTSFAAALKYVLRQDPDVILIGEMRDLETIHAALTAAETGHLVLATLHTNDAVQAIDRMIDVFPPHQQPQVRAQLSSALLGVVSQRLLPRIDTGGRVAAFEVMVATPPIRTLVRDGKMHQALGVMETQRAAGMVTMDQAIESLYRRGYISHEDAMRFVRNPEVLGHRPA